MTSTQEELWHKIERFQLDDADADFSFTDRLCRENGWTYTYAIRVIQEYKKFMFLICISKHPLTPSDQVDQVWHLHLLYTRSYWMEFCQQTLGRDIHHGPTKGGNSEREKFKDWYEETKVLYERIFQQQTPDDIWPDSKKRFGALNFRRINLDRYWLIPKLRKR
ncbi:MAG: hypothetical protein AAGI23_04220 [Bacteroidota bacterium]